MSLQELELLEITPEDKTPPESRLKDAAAALSIFMALDDADTVSATARTNVQAMLDGAAPYNQAKLVATGQGSRCNLNFGEGARHLDTAVAGFVDLVNSVQDLARVYTTLGEMPERDRADAIISTELSRQMRSDPGFHSNFLRLATEFIAHGVGVLYFPDTTGWQFHTCGLSDVRIPRQTRASDEAVDIMFARREYMTHELWGFIRDEKAAARAGWNREEVLRVIHHATSSSHLGRQSTAYDIEQTQKEFRNNDLYNGVKAKVCPVIHAWVREYDNTISHYMLSANDPKDFMFSKPGRFSSTERAFTFFTYGVGTNGTFHGIRGLGAKIFPHVQVSNRLRCQAVDGAMLASAVMLQPETQRALDDLALTYYGPYAILSPNVKIVEKAIPDLTQSVIPVLGDMGQQMAQNLDFYTHDKSAPEHAYRNQLTVEAELELATRLSTATLNLFYVSWNRAVRETCRRIIESPVKLEFHRRVEELGITPEILKSVDHAKTHAVRAVGSGSQTIRSGAMRELYELMPQFDDTGRRNLLRDRVAARVGYEIADRYVSMQDAPRETTDDKLAAMENSLILMGQPMEINGSDIHRAHLNKHVPKIMEIVQAVNAGQMDPMQVLDGLTALHQHAASHVEALAPDVTLTEFTNQMRQALQQSEEIIMNFTRKRDAEARKAQEAQAQGSGPQQEGSPQVDMKAEEARLRMELMKREADTKNQMALAEHQQKMALRDAEVAVKLRTSQSQ